MGAFHHPSNTSEYDRIVAEVRERLGDDPSRAAWSEGRSMPFEQAITCALEAVLDEGVDADPSAGYVPQ